MASVKVAQKPDEPEVVAEVIAQSIEKIGKAVAAMRASRLTDDAIVLLLHDASKVGKPDIRDVLRALVMLEGTYLKPKPARS